MRFVAKGICTATNFIDSVNILYIINTVFLMVSIIFPTVLFFASSISGRCFPTIHMSIIYIIYVYMYKYIYLFTNL